MNWNKERYYEKPEENDGLYETELDSTLKER